LPVSFPAAAREALQDAQLRRNVGKATTLIRGKRERVVAELPDWEALRDAGEAIKAQAMATLPEQLEKLEAAVTAAGGVVHWARDGAEANAIVARIAREHGTDEVIKVKSLATDEIEMNEALEAQGISAIETDLAELIVQLGGDTQSHILVPAIHRNRAEIRALFERTIAVGQDLGTEAKALADAARAHLRAKVLSVPVAVSGANFGVAETGTIAVVESEGNGRMCLTLPRTLVTIMGIEKVLPQWRDLEVFLQLLPRSSTAERMNPYTSLWTGVRSGDGPQEFHLVLLDNGRTDVLADEVGRAALHCIRCSACLNVCPVYERVGGQAYESVYPGPIGAILTPQLRGLDQAPSLPWASSLCGACYEVCPVKIDIPSILVHLRGRVVREEKSKLTPEALAMKGMALAFGSRRRYEGAQRLSKLGRGPLASAAVPGWSAMRDLPTPPAHTFRDWWKARAVSGAASPPSAAARAVGASPPTAGSPEAGA
jgi:L-lactate dehydrogenase complex protein LldF